MSPPHLVFAQRAPRENNNLAVFGQYFDSTACKALFVLSGRLLKIDLV